MKEIIWFIKIASKKTNLTNLETLDKYFRTVLSSKKHQIPSLKTTKDLILEHFTYK